MTTDLSPVCRDVLAAVERMERREIPTTLERVTAVVDATEEATRRALDVLRGRGFVAPAPGDAWMLTEAGLARLAAAVRAAR